MRGPTYISSEIVDQKDAAFPAMTVCPVSNGYKEEVLEDNGIESIKRYNYKTDLNWSSNDTSITESELFEKATYNLNELVKRVYVRFFKANPVRYFPIKNPYLNKFEFSFRLSCFNTNFLELSFHSMILYSHHQF